MTSSVDPLRWGRVRSITWSVVGGVAAQLVSAVLTLLLVRLATALGMSEWAIAVTIFANDDIATAGLAGGVAFLLARRLARAWLLTGITVGIVAAVPFLTILAIVAGISGLVGASLMSVYGPILVLVSAVLGASLARPAVRRDVAG